jgi:hypothetical protein
MPGEMISGPDMGGGFLFQLTAERSPEGVIFTYHAQEGGPDAAGPPLGSPEPLGYVQFPGMCWLGGRACFHRTFALISEDSLRVRTAYNRARFVLGAEMEQLYRAVPVEAEAALREMIERIGPIPGWGCAGATRSWILGESPAPTYLELRTSRAGADRIDRELREYVTEPTAPTPWRAGELTYGGRAFVGTFVKGALVEWRTGSTRNDSDTSESPWSASGRSHPWQGIPVPLADS